LFIHKAVINPMLHITDSTHLLIKVVVFLGLIIPLYNLTLYIVGYLLGYKQFFKSFITKSFLRPITYIIGNLKSSLK